MMTSISRSKARRSPSSENSFGVIARPDGVERLVHVEQAEQVVEPVVEGVRIALDVEEQVAGRWWRQRRQPALDARPRSPGAGAKSSYWSWPSRRPSSWIRACSRTRTSAPSPTSSSGGSIGSGEVAERLERRRHRARPALAAAGPMIPATRLRWSSSRRRVAHSAAQRQTSQCSTGSG